VVYIGAPLKDSEREADANVSSVGMALLCALLTAVFLLIWPPAPWWTALLASVLAGPLFIFSADGMRRAVESTVRRGRWQADVGTTGGLINGVVLAGLLAAGLELPVLVAILSGIAAWAVVALLIAFLLPHAAGQVAQG
jgi:serine/threonine-protein kinase